MSRPLVIQCDSHGPAPWTGQVVCGACGLAWHLNVDNPPTADGTCVCGAELIAPKGSDRKGAARLICPGCFTKLRAQQKASRS